MDTEPRTPEESTQEGPQSSPEESSTETKDALGAWRSELQRRAVDEYMQSHQVSREEAERMLQAEAPSPFSKVPGLVSLGAGGAVSGFRLVSPQGPSTPLTGGPSSPSQGSGSPGAEGESGRTGRKSPTPAGKVKASFNLLPEDIDSLRAMASRLGTTVTSIVQRAIRDESFIQDQLATGNRFAIVDREGISREIIWR